MKIASAEVAYSRFKLVAVMTWNASQLLFIINVNNSVVLIGCSEEQYHIVWEDLIRAWVQVPKI